jgi:hypothetical protein
MTFQSVTFGTDNRTVISTDHDHLNRGVQNPNALSDTQKANVNIATRDGNLSTWNSHGGNAQVTSPVTSVQMLERTGRVMVAGHSVTEEVAATLAETAPDLVTRVRGADGKDEYLTVDPAAKAAEAAKEADNAKDEEAKREEINRFVDPEAEAASLHVNSDVSLSDRTQLLWQLHSTGTVNGPTLQRVAEQMFLPVDQAVEALNAIHTNHSMQVATLCGAKGVDAQGFAAWAKTNRATEMFRAVTIQANERDFVRAWSGLVDEFKARGGK